MEVQDIKVAPDTYQGRFMKRIHFIMLSVLLLFACTDDNSTTEPTTEGPMRHLQRMDCTVTEGEHSFSWYNTYIWDGDNLVQYTHHYDDGDPDLQFDFHIENGRVAFSTLTVNGEQYPWCTYHYDGDRIDYIVFEGEKYYYTYNGEKIVTINFTEGNEEMTFSLSWNGDNCTQIDDQSINEPEWIKYDFDGKRNPLKLPMGVGLQEMGYELLGLIWSNNNYTHYSQSNGDSYTATYTHDGDYPTRRTVSGENYSEEYTFTYSD